MSYQDDYQSNASGNRWWAVITIAVVLFLWLTLGEGKCWRPGP
jgi:hypothetical protein